MDFEMDSQEDDARPMRTSPQLVQAVSLFYLPKNRYLLPLTKSNHPHTYPHQTLTESALPWVEPLSFLLQTYPPHHLFRQTILPYLLGVASYYLMRYS